MSSAGLVRRAVTKAKIALGDTVINALLDKVSTVYDTSTGRNVETVVTQSLEVVIVKADYLEIQAGDIRQSDIKVIVFNTEDDKVRVSVQDKIWLNSVQYNVVKSTPSYVGNVISIFEVFLRK